MQPLYPPPLLPQEAEEEARVVARTEELVSKRLRVGPPSEETSAGRPWPSSAVVASAAAVAAAVVGAFVVGARVGARR